MKNFKNELNNQQILSPNVERLLKDLSAGTLSSCQFHNKKAYAKRSGDVIGLVELTVAFELYKLGYNRYE